MSLQPNSVGHAAEWSPSHFKERDIDLSVRGVASFICHRHPKDAMFQTTKYCIGQIISGGVTIYLVWCLSLIQVNLEGWGNTQQTSE